MSIAKLWANKVYDGISIDLVPTKYLGDVKIILEEMKIKENKDIHNYYIAKKIKELDKICQETIFYGLDITLSGGETEHFTLTERDQLNLSGIALKLLMGAETVAWHEDDETVPCRFYSANDASLIIGTLTTYKEYHITYFRDLRIYVNSLSSVAEINAVQYGFALPEEAKSNVLKAYEQQLGIVT